VRIDFGIAVPAGSELQVKHEDGSGLLSVERVPLAAGSRYWWIKTHPDALQIACTLAASGQVISDACVSVDVGGAIAPVGRHFIVIGAMKAGTTSLFQWMAQHPAICRTWAEIPGVSSSKEINYFNKIYGEDDTPGHYDWRFPFDPAKHRWTLDVSTNYAKLQTSKNVPARIAALNAKVKLAYILRDPLERIESQIAHSLREGEGEEKTTLSHCIRISRYTQHLDSFLKHFSRDDILLLDFDQLRGDPRGLQLRICEFLGIDQLAVPPRIHNRGTVRYKLTSTQRAEIIEAVRPDIQRLIEEHDFRPAESWLGEKPRRFPFSLRR
jgi:hypothetical protein